MGSEIDVKGSDVETEELGQLRQERVELRYPVKSFDIVD